MGPKREHFPICSKGNGAWKWPCQRGQPGLSPLPPLSEPREGQAGLLSIHQSILRDVEPASFPGDTHQGVGTLLQSLPQRFGRL